MSKHWLWLLVLIPMVVTYGAMYSDAQHFSDGYMSHQHNATDHARAVLWAIYPPMWFVAPFITNGYEHGLQFRHHHGKFCDPGWSIRTEPCEQR